MLGSIGRYELRAEITDSAKDVVERSVYDAWDPVFARRVAIKTVRLARNAEEARDQLLRFKREAQAVGRLDHPNIVDVYDFGETDGLAYIVMKFVTGRSLKENLDQGDRSSLRKIVAIMQDVLGALDYSHARGVIHRDVKPGNVMITTIPNVQNRHQGERAILVDFGIATIENITVTKAGMMIGAPAYMSPEQFMGYPTDSRTDIYSSGVLLYELLTGKRPFEGSVATIMHKTLHAEPPKPSGLSLLATSALDAVVARAMAKRPDDRFPSAAAFARALTQAAGASNETEVSNTRTIFSTAAADARRVASAARASMLERRWLPPLGIGFAAAGFLVLVGGGAWFVSQLNSGAGDKPALQPPASVAPSPAEPPGNSPRDAAGVPRSDAREPRPPKEAEPKNPSSAAEKPADAPSTSPTKAAPPAAAALPSQASAPQLQPNGPDMLTRDQQEAPSVPPPKYPSRSEPVRPAEPDRQAQPERVEPQRETSPVPSPEPSSRRHSEASPQTSTPATPSGPIPPPAITEPTAPGRESSAAPGTGTPAPSPAAPPGGSGRATSGTMPKEETAPIVPPPIPSPPMDLRPLPVPPGSQGAQPNGPSLQKPPGTHQRRHRYFDYGTPRTPSQNQHTTPGNEPPSLCTPELLKAGWRC